MNAETKQIKFPNGSTIIFFSPKSGLSPKSDYMGWVDAAGNRQDAFYVPVLDIAELKVFEKFACNDCNGTGIYPDLSPCPSMDRCDTCKGSGSLYREAASE